MKIRKTLRNVVAVLVVPLVVQTATCFPWAQEARGRLMVLKSLGGFEGGPPVFSHIVLDNGTLGQLAGREYSGMTNVLEERGTKMIVHALLSS